MDEHRRRRDILAAAGGSLLLAGCLGGGDDSEDSTTGDEPAGDIEWRSATIEDVTTGESFAVDEIDRPVVIHTFAPFCPTCKEHQDTVTDDYTEVDDEMEFVDLMIDGNDDPDTARSHAEDNGYGWRFGVASEALTSALVDEFGQDVAVHNQSPLIVVCPDGAAETIEKPAGISDIRTTIHGTCN